MNYGRFFRLNQSLSDVSNGIAIYDYIDLPAYFGFAADNPMSPKYPISVTITADLVCFHLHYSAFKIENKDGQDDPRYAYNKDEIDKKAFIFEKDNPNVIGMAHMEETILELPFMDNSTNRLSDTIKSIYKTTFPQVIDKKNSLGGRFLEQLIKKRYPSSNDSTSVNILNNIEAELYKKIRDTYDDSSSYSSLWLMDLYKEGRINLYQKVNIEETGEKKEIYIVTNFLRKILLDFMFDLKHSDVFQNSTNYQKMLSGLMSDFFFSALMHKCEYYFYRRLITDKIENEEHTNVSNIKILYADKLFEAETLWIHDIMSPSAEKHFEHHYIDEKLSPKGLFRKKLWEKIKKSKDSLFTFRNWDSWFASPEEEMRRVYFTMKEENGDTNHYHCCNTEVIAEFINQNGKQLDERILNNKNIIKAEVSQWFLRRFSFEDILHLHLFKFASCPFFLTIVIFLSLLFLIPEFFSLSFWESYYIYVVAYFLFWMICVFCLYYFPRTKNQNNTTLWEIKRKLVRKRTLAFLLFCFSVLISISVDLFVFYKIEDHNLLKEESFYTLLKILSLIIQILLICGLWYIINKYVYRANWVLKMHVFLPRLISAIVTAWLTLAVKNLFGAFFDTIVAWAVSIWLCIIIFAFLMYELNKRFPFDSMFAKAKRCLELMTISYMISLIVGACFINYAGETFINQGNTLIDYYEKNDNSNNAKIVEGKKYWIRKEPNYSHKEYDLNGLEHIHIVYKDSMLTKEDFKHPIVTQLSIGNVKIFILRDFLIQFSFVAMFIGIFIHMLFEKRTITEV